MLTRQIMECDFSYIVQLRNKYIRFLRQKKLLTMKDQRKWFKNYIKDDRNYYYLAEKKIDNNLYTGIIGLTHINWIDKHCELSFISNNYIDDTLDHSIIECINYAFNDFDFNKIYNEVYEFDTKKIDLCNRLGFKQSATLKEHIFFDGKFLDCYIYHITKKEWHKK
jgi:RimJ/RimL family protein N-acetyltransferase